MAYYRLRRLYNCDNLPVLRELKSETVSLALLDPPFNKRQAIQSKSKRRSTPTVFKDNWRWDDVEGGAGWHFTYAGKALVRLIEYARSNKELVDDAR